MRSKKKKSHLITNDDDSSSSIVVEMLFANSNEYYTIDVHSQHREPEQESNDRDIEMRRAVVVAANRVLIAMKVGTHFGHVAKKIRPLDG